MNDNINNAETQTPPEEGIKGGLNRLFNAWQMVRYNLKIIFGNKFIYFLLSAIAITLLIVGINLFNGDDISEGGIYNMLIMAGALLIFYPAAFGLQSDKDGRTMEIIFGIPDYRYRVWFMRLVMIYVLTLCILAVLAWGMRYVFVSFSLLGMLVQVLFPLAFLGFLTFFLSTVLRSGNATAAVVIVLSLIILILSESLSDSYWNIFFNPYKTPSDTSSIVWQSLAHKNRIFLGIGTVVFLLGGMMNLQKRERLLG